MLMQRAVLWIVRLDPTTAELLLAGAAIAFGVALTQMTDLSARSPSFQRMVEIAPQSAWAVVWIVFGIGQLLGACLGWGRRHADIAATALWLFWTVVQVMAMGLTLGPFVYGWLALAGFVASQLRPQVRHARGAG